MNGKTPWVVTALFSIIMFLSMVFTSQVFEQLTELRREIRGLDDKMSRDVRRLDDRLASVEGQVREIGKGLAVLESNLTGRSSAR